MPRPTPIPRPSEPPTTAKRGLRIVGRPKLTATERVIFDQAMAERYDSSMPPEQRVNVINATMRDVLARRISADRHE